jgi:hypothetical protein
MVREETKLDHPDGLGKAAVRAGGIKLFPKKGWQFQAACV